MQLFTNSEYYLTNFFTGTVTVVAPLYIAEISPTPLRGAMGTCHQLMVTIGILLGQVRVIRVWMVVDNEGYSSSTGLYIPRMWQIGNPLVVSATFEQFLVFYFPNFF